MNIFKSIIKKIKQDNFNISHFFETIHHNDDDKFYWYLKNFINKQNINLVNNSGNSALHLACQARNADFTIALLNAGANPNIIDNKGETPLFTTCTTSKEIHKIYMSLMPHILNSNLRMSIGSLKYDNLFKNYIDNTEKNFQLANILISYRANIHILGKEKNTCLHQAINAEDIKTVTLLIENGANLHLKNEDGNTPFDFALKAKNHDILDIIFYNTKNLEEAELFIQETIKAPEIYKYYDEKLNSIKINFHLNNSLDPKEKINNKIKI